MVNQSDFADYLAAIEETRQAAEDRIYPQQLEEPNCD